MRVPLTIGDFLSRAATVYGDRTAVMDEPSTPAGLGALSYRQLEARARGMAMALDEMGVEVGERVAIVSPNAARFLVAFFGVSGYGRILVPVNFRLNRAEVGYIVEHSGASVLLVDPDVDDHLGGVSAKERIVLDGRQDARLFAEAPADAAPRPWQPDEDAPASINYTSGTTARPKGVQLTHRNCWLNAVIFGWQAAVTDRDVFMHTLPMFHCNGWGMPYAVTAMGCAQVVVRKVDGGEILRRIERHGVTLLCGAPAVVSAILDGAEPWRERGEPVPGNGRVRIVVAGAPPPSKMIERVEDELGWEFIQIYGLTETAPLLTMNRSRSEWDSLEPADRARLLARAGMPAVGVRIGVDNQQEVLARSNHVFAGYWEQPAETARAMNGGWFHTGDGGYLDDQGYLVISDRKKDVIISGGENVSSIEVEDCLYQHPAVAEVAVIGIPDDKWGETVAALVVLREAREGQEAGKGEPGAAGAAGAGGGQGPTEQDLIDFARARMAHFKCPTHIEFRDSLLRTATGKLQKFKLRQPYWEGHERGID